MFKVGDTIESFKTGNIYVVIRSCIYGVEIRWACNGKVFPEEWPHSMFRLIKSVKPRRKLPDWF